MDGSSCRLCEHCVVELLETEHRDWNSWLAGMCSVNRNMEEILEIPYRTLTTCSGKWVGEFSCYRMNAESYQQTITSI